ncbi:hypothetical protein M408DRAFT_329042 [Serendipita vermifera MAFF 305830]|uniref:Uncharacterized protein n=1 Tax=Serendipita vermifera MAFF 305830 TaxID=933852 RepID=A0A0C3BA55_SERVB|nr:hypothetical protein M408DRAFT_329042 [Serendipita vermifera MAFF 305830]
MGRQVLSLFLFVSFAAAKGRGGGGSIDGIDDGWDAPPAAKALMAFLILFCLASLALLVIVFKYLKRIPTMSFRGPYILLSVNLVLSAIYYLLWTIYLRLELPSGAVVGFLETSIGFLVDIPLIILPSAVLYITHQHSVALQRIKGSGFIPLASRKWKQILDWSLAGLIFILCVVNVCIHGVLRNNSTSTAQTSRLSESSRNLKYAIVAFELILCVNTVVSVVIHFFQTQCAQSNTSIVKLLLISIPFFVVFTLEVLAINIFLRMDVEYGRMGLVFAQIMIEGICKLCIAGILVLSMLPRNSPWASQETGPQLSVSHLQEQWHPLNVAWQQPLSNQQQQYQQAGYQNPSYSHSQQSLHHQQQPYYQHPQMR